MRDKYKVGILLLIATVLFVSYNVIVRNQVSEALSRYGSRGSEVSKIQTKLKNWGYYTGSVDGIYGSSTLSAVKKFQRKNGLTADGIAGKATLEKMGIFSSSSKSSGSVSSSSLNLISRFVYAESRGEPYKGQVAVAAVILNRVKDSRFPNTVSGVVHQSGAFTCVSDGQINLSPNDTARKGRTRCDEWVGSYLWSNILF